MKNTYITNGVILSSHEQKTVYTLLANGHSIELIPRSMTQGIHTADIILDGKHTWEIKCPKGNGK